MRDGTCFKFGLCFDRPLVLAPVPIINLRTAFNTATFTLAKPAAGIKDSDCSASVQTMENAPSYSLPRMTDCWYAFDMS